MNDTPTARAGYFQGERMELGLRYAYRPEFVPLLMTYLGAKPGMSMLEVGCGSGFLARLLARTLPGVRVLGLDSDASLLDIAGQMQARDGLTDQIVWGQGDAFRLPFPDDHFDLVTSHRLL